jgi:hypothetical protein
LATKATWSLSFHTASDGAHLLCWLKNFARLQLTPSSVDEMKMRLLGTPVALSTSLVMKAT